MLIEYLYTRTEYVGTVTNWIYNEFVKSKQHCPYEKVYAHFSNTHLNSFPITLVALIGDICVGTVSVVENDLKSQNVLTPWLASLYVTPQYRCQGIAKSLIYQVFEIAKGMGYQTIYLRTEHIASYYKKRGWVFVYKTLDETAQETAVFKYAI